MPRELHLHVEEESMEAFLKAFLPRFLDPAINWKPINHQSKQQLLRELPNRLRGYGHIPSNVRPKSLVLIDRDKDDCRLLKQRIEESACIAGLSTKTNPAADGSFDVVNRIVIEELEAWFFGSVPALAIAWPGVPANLAAQTAYRDPDAIAGGTHEALFRVLQQAGHHKGAGRLPKIDTARRMGRLLDPATNGSRSFQQFRSGLVALTQQN